MAVNLDAVDTSNKPDPNFKPDPKLRGDIITKDKIELEEDPDLDLEPQDKLEKKAAPVKKAPAKKKVEIDEEEPDEEDAPEEEEEEEDLEEEEFEEEPASKKSSANQRIQQVIADKKAALDQLEALRAENEKLREKQTTTEKKEFDALQVKLDELYEKVEEQRALGEYKEAAKIQRQLDDMRGSMSRAETVLLSRQAALQQQEVNVFNTALAQIEAIFPELSSKHKDFDQETLVALDETIKGYEANGDSPPDALRKAARRLLRYDPFARGDDAYLPGNPHTPGKEPAKSKVKATDVKANIKASNKQPVDPADDNSDVETVIDPKKVKPEDWHKLPESVRKKLRGDTR